MLLSIIIPVYNVEKYLRKCLSSFLNIGLETDSYEILVINDGSPDNSLEIAKEFESIHENIFVFTKSNGGLSSARNYGLREAKGQYIWFFDSDDYLFDVTLSDLLEMAISKDLDVVAFNWNKTENGDLLLDDNASKIAENTQIIRGEKLYPILNFRFYAHRFLFKKEFFKYTFREGIYFEDMELIPQVVLNAQKAIGVVDVLYAYRQRPGSILSSGNPKLIYDSLKVAEIYKNKYTQTGNIHFKDLYKHSFRVAYHSLAYIPGKEVRDAVTKFVADHQITSIYENRGLKKVANALFNYSPAFLLTLIKLFKK